MRDAKSAKPPRSAKIGAPSTPAKITIANQGTIDWFSMNARCSLSTTPATMPRRAMARPDHSGDARHTSRTAISPKPIGSARSASQVGRPAVT